MGSLTDGRKRFAASRQPPTRRGPDHAWTTDELTSNAVIGTAFAHARRGNRSARDALLKLRRAGITPEMRDQLKALKPTDPPPGDAA